VAPHIRWFSYRKRSTSARGPLSTTGRLSVVVAEEQGLQNMTPFVSGGINMITVGSAGGTDAPMSLLSAGGAQDTLGECGWVERHGPQVPLRSENLYHYRDRSGARGRLFHD